GRRRRRRRRRRGGGRAGLPSGGAATRAPTPAGRPGSGGGCLRGRLLLRAGRLRRRLRLGVRGLDRRDGTVGLGRHRCLVGRRCVVVRPGGNVLGGRLRLCRPLTGGSAGRPATRARAGSGGLHRRCRGGGRPGVGFPGAGGRRIGLRPRGLVVPAHREGGRVRRGRAAVLLGGPLGRVGVAVAPAAAPTTSAAATALVVVVGLGVDRVGVHDQTAALAVLTRGGERLDQPGPELLARELHEP